MLWIVVILFCGAIAAPALRRITGRWTGPLLALLPLGAIGWAAGHWSPVMDGEAVRQTHAWAPTLSANFSFQLDGLSMVFLLLICGVGALILIYAGRYLSESSKLGLFFGYLLFFMGAMVGLVLADNLFLLFVFWELTSISSFLLIGWNHHLASARKAALTSLLVTTAGGMMLMAGLVLLGQIGGAFEVSQISGDAVRESPLYLLTLILILGGAFTKSAQVPFHFWLPGAMAAPTPVSAYLHSATMVKAGIYLLARLHPQLGGTEAWLWILGLAGGATMIVGAMVAVTQTDLKRILAYSTVSVLGTLTLLIGIGTEMAIWAAMAYLVAHSLYKGALFLIAGALDHETGSRDITKLSGLAKLMPFTAGAAILAAASGAGLAPLFGFVSKELFYEATWAAEPYGPVIFVVVFGASSLMVVVSLMVGYRPFFGGPPTAPILPHEAPIQLWLGPVVLAATGLIAGLSPVLLNRLLAAGVAEVTGEATPVKLALWHGFTPMLAMSLLTLVLGAGLFVALRRRQKRLLVWSEKMQAFGPQRLYDRVFAGSMRFAEIQTGVIQSGYLRNYVLVIALTLLALLARPVFEGLDLFAGDPDLLVSDLALGGIMLGGTVAVIFMKSRLAVAVALGAMGMVVMLIYVAFGALDLALTQIMVETLTVILLVLVLYHLPRFVAFSSRWVLLRDAAVSLMFGGVIAILVLKAFAVSPDPSLREYFAATSYVEAHGRNVVNVILVDFRAMDTLGEVTVLAIAGIGVYALLKIRPKRDRKEEEEQ